MYHLSGWCSYSCSGWSWPIRVATQSISVLRQSIPIRGDFPNMYEVTVLELTLNRESSEAEIRGSRLIIPIVCYCYRRAEKWRIEMYLYLVGFGLQWWINCRVNWRWTRREGDCVQWIVEKGEGREHRSPVISLAGATTREKTFWDVWCFVGSGTRHLSNTKWTPLKYTFTENALAIARHKVSDISSCINGRRVIFPRRH
jgi:hypothetical protein